MDFETKQKIIEEKIKNFLIDYDYFSRKTKGTMSWPQHSIEEYEKEPSEEVQKFLNAVFTDYNNYENLYCFVIYDMLMTFEVYLYDDDEFLEMKEVFESDRGGFGNKKELIKHLCQQAYPDVEINYEKCRI